MTDRKQTDGKKAVWVYHRNKILKGELEFYRYKNGNLKVDFNDEDGLRYATLSADVDIVLKLKNDEFVAKTYSENSGLVEQFIENGYFVRTGIEVPVGIAPLQPVLKVPFFFEENE